MLRHIGSTRNKTGRSILYAASVAAVATLAVSLSEAGPAKADFGTSEDPIVVSPLTWNPTYMPITPFKATDGLYHLQYQLLVLEVFSSPATVADGDVLDADTREATGHNQSISDDGHDIRLKVRPFASTGEGHALDFVSTVPAGQAGLMFFYLSYPTIDAIPARLQHRFTVERGDTTRITATDAGLTRVSTEQPIVIGPTMRGSGWLDGNGAGLSTYEHRITLQPANGTVKPDQAYAIDWIKLDEQGHTFHGDPFKNESFFAYGQPILSATDGFVVSAEDGFPNQIPNKFEPIKQIKELYGNNVVVAIGDGKYAVYAHLKPGSVAVKVGEHLHAGRQLGELGDSGNSTAPHLHFQISDAPSILDANSLPFVFNSMHYSERIVGAIFPTIDEMTLKNFVPKFDRAGAAWRKQEMPLQGDVIDFP
jgi:hypothetical protein